MLRFHDHDDFIEIAVVREGDAALPSRGDVYLTLRILSAGFSGHNGLWVLGTDFDAFCTALRRLEEQRRGEARLTGIDPRELSIVVRSVDSKGHMIVEGHTGYAVGRDVTMPFHSVQFGIEFDPSQLTTIKSVSWFSKRGSANPLD